MALPIDHVVAVGTHAVMVEAINSLSDEDELPDEMIADEKADVLRDEVITESGTTLGRVRDVIISGGAAPRVVAFEIADGPAGEGFVPLRLHAGVSGSALIVPDEHQERMRHDLTELAADLATAEERS